MLMILFKGHIHGGTLKAFSYTRFYSHLQFLDFLCERVVYVCFSYVQSFSLNHTSETFLDQMLGGFFKAPDYHSGIV